MHKMSMVSGKGQQTDRPILVQKTSFKFCMSWLWTTLKSLN